MEDDNDVGFDNDIVFDNDIDLDNDIGLDNELLKTLAGVLYAMPALVELRSGISGLGKEFESIDDDELPDHIISAYGNARKDLQVWRVNMFDPSMIEWHMLMALVCPKLRLILLKCGSVLNLAH
ncbi:hypothetical protein IWW39_006128 [Coemansia spiralis]|uniref:Uncharacterized protein n=1 Tax=Coemansia spiralis TaxID=417178 RepID=A0A9W8L1T0_9FUNG|nr:hypothetical protein IWW39_006128 [Coemansia spiralis]